MSKGEREGEKKREGGPGWLDLGGGGGLRGVTCFK